MIRLEVAQKVRFDGISGRIYYFLAYPLTDSLSFADNLRGNYIFVRHNDNTGWSFAIYIGEGKINDRLQHHMRVGCVKEKGATHLFVMRNDYENSRLAIEADLLKKHTEAYSPNGCNVKIGG